MGLEKIDWDEQFNEEKSDNFWTEEVIDIFVESAKEELEPLHIGDDIISKLDDAGLKIRGVRYFDKLYSKDEDITPEERAKSVFIGSVAYGKLILANEAYSLLSSLGDNSELNKNLVGRLNGAIRKERTNNGLERIDRLEGAAKALGKPLHQRIFGGLAIGFAMHNS